MRGVPGTGDWPLLSGLAEPARERLLGLARPRTFDRGEVVCRAGDPGDSLHLVDEGHLLVQVSLPSGATATLNVLGPGDFLGELALLRDDSVRTATVTALEPARTRAITGADFQRFRREWPEVERALSALLAARVDQLSHDLLEALYVGLEERVRVRLASLAAMYDEGSPVVSVPVTQAQLAEMVGGTRPSVNQVLQVLEAAGTVELHRGRIDVHHAEGLAG